MTVVVDRITRVFETCRLIPVIKLDDKKDALPLGKALMQGGLPIAEITFRTGAAQDSIKAMAGAYPDMTVGAGSVGSVGQARDAIAAGAQFIVSAGLSHKVTDYCISNGIPVFPGVCTPTEVLAALEYGLSVLKFFPAGQYGGISAIKAISAPFPGIRFLPTGGVNQNNIISYLKEKCIIACGGSWMVRDSLILRGDFATITELTRQAVQTINELQPAENL